MPALPLRRARGKVARVAATAVEREHRVTPRELFFDLVFVFAFTQVATLRDSLDQLRTLMVSRHNRRLLDERRRHHSRV
jgi:hypothetical protein